MPWSLILDVGLMILKWVFQMKDEKDESKKAFLEFVGKLESMQMASVNLNEDSRKQLEELRKTKENQ